MSNKEQIETSLKSLILDDNRAFVAMLSGEWGIGKTYFWNEFASNFLEPKQDFMRGNPKKSKDVVYISLFGKSSLADIETEIVTKLYKYNKGLKKYTKYLDTIGNMASKVIGLPVNVSVGSLLSLFKASDFKNIIICFDDFERLSDKVPLKDVMGLISQFKEQKECKVIMILNEKELDRLSDIDGKKHDEIFALYKEKVVDYSFHYQPSQEELFVAIKEDIEKITFCEHQTIYDFFTKIDLKNIRIMKQGVYQLGHFNFIKDDSLDEKVVNEFVHIALRLFVFKANNNYTYTQFNDIKKYRPAKKLEGDKKDTIVAVNKKDENNQNNYTSDNRYYSKEYLSTNTSIIEKIIYTFIDSHRLSETHLQKELKQNHQSLERYDIRNEISELHTRFYTDFSVSNSQIAEQLFNLLSEHKDVMHRLFQYDSYKPFMEIINQFSPETDTNSLEEEIAKNYIIFYSENTTSSTDYQSRKLRLLTSDYAWAGKFIEDNKKKSIEITPNYILTLLENTLNRGYLSDEDAFKLNQISPKEYETQIKENPNLIQPLVEFLNIPYSKSGRENIIDALKSLKKENADYKWKVEQIFKSSEIAIEDEK